MKLATTSISGRKWAGKLPAKNKVWYLASTWTLNSKKIIIFFCDHLVDNLATKLPPIFRDKQLASSVHWLSFSDHAVAKFRHQSVAPQIVDQIFFVTI